MLCQFYIIRDWESILNWPYHSCHCRGSPWYWHNFHLGSGLFLLLVMASADGLSRLAFSAAGAGVVGCCGPAQHNDIGAVCSYNGCTMGKKKGGAMLVVVLKGLTGILRVAALLLFKFCWGVDCKIWWLMAGLEVHGGSVGWNLLKTAAIFVAWHTFVRLFWGKRHNFRLKLYLGGRFVALGQGNRWACDEWRVFCFGLLGMGG